MSYDKEKIKETDTEILSPDERKISEMLGNLRMIGAPKDFDHRLKARIANSSPVRHNSAGFLPVLRYVLPLGLFFVIGATLIWNNSLNIDQDNVPSIAETTQPVAPVITAPLQADASSRGIETSSVQPNISNSSPVKIEEVIARQPKTSARKIEKNSGTDNRSFDIALGQAPKPILPKGFDTEPVITRAAPPGFENKRRFTAKEVFSAIGVEAEFDSRSWKVRSVVKDSAADRSGIRAGDLMEAIDGRPLDDKTIFTGGFSAKTINIVRESKSLLIELKNR